MFTFLQVSYVQMYHSIIADTVNFIQKRWYQQDGTNVSDLLQKNSRKKTSTDPTIPRTTAIVILQSIKISLPRRHLGEYASLHVVTKAGRQDTLLCITDTCLSKIQGCTSKSLIEAFVTGNQILYCGVYYVTHSQCAFWYQYHRHHHLTSPSKIR